MSKESEEQPEPSFEDIPVETSKESRQIFLDTDDGDEKGKAFGEFVDQLQKEADNLQGPSRDLWLNLQITQTFIDAEMWERALEAVEDAEYLAKVYKNGEAIFDNLRKEIEENILTK